MRKVLASFLLLSTATFGAEVDSFTNRYKPIADSVDLINGKTNELFSEAIDEVNEKSKKGCDEKKLYKYLRKRFRNHYTGMLSPWIIKTDKIERIVTPVTNSIYQDFKWYQAIVPGGIARVFGDPSAALIKVNGVMLGTDKFEHFMGSGFLYYRKNYLKGKGIKEAMKIGWSAETGYMGAVTTGVMAYGDLAANFNGMRFWNHVLLKYNDILGEQYNQGPYVKCEENQWKQVAKVDWRNYIDHAFDEGVNCSKIHTEKMTDQVLARIDTLEKTDGQSYGCPALPYELEKLKDKYGKYSETLLNMDGIVPMKIKKKK